jgi:hypothetical protein
MDNQTEVVDVRLPNGLLMGVEVVRERGAGDVSALDHLDFAHVQGVLDGLAQVVSGALARSRPHRATAEMGLNLKVESGKLTGVLVQAGGSASLKVSLTWEHGPALGESAPTEASEGEPATGTPSAVGPAEGRHAD